MKSAKFLDQYMKKHDLKSDRSLALRLGLTAGAVSHYRTGRRIMDNETCLKIALELDVDPVKVIMAADLDRAAKTGQKSTWNVFLDRASKATATAVMSCILPLNVQSADVKNFLTLPDSPALENQQVKSDQKTDNLYIM